VEPGITGREGGRGQVLGAGRAREKTRRKLHFFSVERRGGEEQRKQNCTRLATPDDELKIRPEQMTILFHSIASFYPPRGDRAL